MIGIGTPRSQRRMPRPMWGLLSRTRQTGAGASALRVEPSPDTVPTKGSTNPQTFSASWPS